MKSIIIKVLFAGLLVTGLDSCTKKEIQLISNVSPAGTLTASATTLNLSLAEGNKPALVLSFPEPQVSGEIIPVTSTIQFDVKGNNFANPKEFVQTATSYAPTINQFNAMMLALGLKIDVPAQVEARLMSAPAANAVTYSNVITLSATPFMASTWIYMPGAYQGWSPPTADSLLSATSNGVYQGIVNFPATQLEFKITPKKNWTIGYGDSGNGSFSEAGANFNAGSEGPKLVTIDMNKKKWEIADAKPWSLIGSATPKGWDGDTDLKFINNGKDTHQLTLELVNGDLKIRFGHDWGVNFGGSITDFTLNGGNVPVTAGNYTITLKVVKMDVNGNPSAINVTMIKN